MTLQSQLNLQARKIFGRIYKNSEIDLKELKATLSDQLNLYLDHLSSHIKKPITLKDRERILEIIDRNNYDQKNSNTNNKFNKSESC